MRRTTIYILLSVLAMILIMSSCCNDRIIHTVVFDPAGGTLTSAETISIEHGNVLEEPSDPYRARYSFAYWENMATDEKYDFTLPVTSDLILVAKWNYHGTGNDGDSDDRAYTVKFDANLPSSLVSEAIPDIEIAAGKGISEGEMPASPVLSSGADGFAFLGWYTVDGIEYTSSIVISSDTTLIAHWVSKWDGSADAESITQQIEDPGCEEIRISTAAQLAGVAKLMEDDKSYQDHTESFGNKPLILANDMDMSGNGWTPIGYHTEYNGSNHFAGEFDGNGHTISNVSISGDDYSGLFSFVSEEGYIHDLAIKGITVMNGSYLGTIAGRNDGTIENCSILERENSVTSSGDYIGGIAGENNGRIINSHYLGELSFSGDFNGGIAGANGKNGYIMASSFQMNDDDYIESSGDYDGGIAGYNEGNIVACYVPKASFYDTKVCSGGIAEASNDGRIYACYFSGDISSNEDYIGGITGANGGILSGCGFIGSIEGDEYVGSIAGSNTPTIEIDRDEIEMTGSVEDSVSFTRPDQWGDTADAVGEGDSSGVIVIAEEENFWGEALKVLNSAIDDWNSAYPENPCRYRYETSGANPPKLIEA